MDIGARFAKIKVAVYNNSFFVLMLSIKDRHNFYYCFIEDTIGCSWARSPNFMCRRHPIHSAAMNDGMETYHCYSKLWWKSDIYVVSQSRQLPQWSMQIFKVHATNIYTHICVYMHTSWRSTILNQVSGASTFKRINWTNDFLVFSALSGGCVITHSWVWTGDGMKHTRRGTHVSLV